MSTSGSPENSRSEPRDVVGTQHDAPFAVRI